MYYSGGMVENDSLSMCMEEAYGIFLPSAHFVVNLKLKVNCGDGGGLCFHASYLSVELTCYSIIV